MTGGDNPKLLNQSVIDACKKGRSCRGVSLVAEQVSASTKRKNKNSPNANTYEGCGTRPELARRPARHSESPKIVLTFVQLIRVCPTCPKRKCVPTFLMPSPPTSPVTRSKTGVLCSCVPDRWSNLPPNAFYFGAGGQNVFGFSGQRPDMFLGARP